MQRTVHISSWTKSVLEEKPYVGRRWPALCGAVIIEDDEDRCNEAITVDHHQTLEHYTSTDPDRFRACKSCLKHPRYALSVLAKTELE